MIQPEIRDISVEDMRRFGFGSYLNGGNTSPGDNKYASAADWVALADAMYQASVDDSLDGSVIPTMWGTDAVHGHNNLVGATLFPHNIGLGAMGDPVLIEAIAKATALEVRATGVDWAFAPTVATARDDRWGRTYESYSESPDVVKDYARAAVYGLQGHPGRDFLQQDSVLSSVKHFIGDGGTYLGDDQGDNRDTEQQLLNIHGQGYVSGLTAGAQIVMASFNSWHGEKVHGSYYLLTDVLKQQMGFDGFVVGDWSGHGQVKGCSNESCPQAINAGLDMFMAPTDAWRPLFYNTLAQVKSGQIPIARIDDAVTRILRVKARFGLFEQGKPSQRPYAGDQNLLGQAAHRKIARQAVRKSLVLLKNHGNLLPLSPTQHIFVAGDGAHNITKQSGGWTLTWQGTNNSNSDFPGATSILEGITEQVTVAGGVVSYDVAGNYTHKPDVAIVIFGENPYAEGHGDRTDVAYQPGDKTDLAILKRLQAAGIPVVSIFLSGRPMWVNAELNASDAFVAAWLPGSEGAGIADVILRNQRQQIQYPISGKLSFSWPNSPYIQVNEGDDPQPILFPFGYGLHYGEHDPLGDDLNETLEAATGQNSERLLYNGQMHAPWLLWLGADSQREQVTSNASRLGQVAYRTADKQVQEDAMHITFSGEGPGQVLFNSKSNFREDLRSDLLQHGELKITVNVHDIGEQPVFLRTQCDSDTQQPCGATLPLMQPAAVLLDRWQIYTVPLRCIAAAGMEFQNTTVPFALYSEGRAAFTLSKVSIVTHAEARDAPCLTVTGE